MKKSGVFFFFCITAILTAAPFVWQTKNQDDQTFVEVAVAENYYLDADSVAFDGATVLELPAPQEKAGQAIYPAGTWRWRVAPQKNFAVSYQGCKLGAKDEAPLCLLPATHRFTIPDAPREEGKLPESIAHAKIIKSFSGAMNQAQFLAWLDTRNARETTALSYAGWLWFLAVIAGGFLLNLTPCVLPMIPVNLAIIGAEKGGKGALRGLVYGLGMAIAYGVLGAVVVLTGARFGDLSGSALFNFAVAVVFGFFALSMTGVVNFDLSHLATVDARKLHGGKLLIAFLLGALAALLAGACVAPVVGAVILAAAEHYAAGDQWGILLPLLLGIGMGLPWPLAGSGIAALPRPGKAMLFIKYGFAAILFGATLRYIVAGVKLLQSDVSPQAEIAKLETALDRAEKENRLVVVDFWATWCENCKSFDRDVLPDPEVQSALQKVIFVKFQAQNSRDPKIRAILHRFNLPGLPGFVMLASQQ